MSDEDEKLDPREQFRRNLLETVRAARREQTAEMTAAQWTRWMSMLERGEGIGKPGKTLPAYILQDDPEWTDAERAAHLAEQRAHLDNIPYTTGAPWVIFQYTDGRQIVLWPPAN